MSTRIEETPTTRAYVKTKAYHDHVPVPSAPWDDGPGGYARHEHHEEAIALTTHRQMTESKWLNPVLSLPPASLLLLLAIVAFFGIGYYLELRSSPPPAYARLLNRSWDFRGHVTEPRRVVREGWSLPAGQILLEVLNTTRRADGQRTVVDRVDRVCMPVEVCVPVLVHTPPAVCTQQQTGWTEPLEKYSHTEEDCYDNGHCEERDVYQKQDPQPIITQVCTHPPPVYAPQCRVEPQCHEHQVTHQEDVWRDWYTFAVLENVPVREVRLASYVGDALGDAALALASTNQSYSHEDWTWWLHWDANATTGRAARRQRVSKSIWHMAENEVGHVVVVP